MASNSSYIPANCKDVEVIAQNITYKFIIFFKAFSNIAAAGIFLFLLFSKVHLKIFHPNTKIIQRFIFIYFYLVALNYSVLYIYEFYRISPFISNPCDRLWWLPLIFSLRTGGAAFTHGVNSSLIILGVERIICISRISNYELSSQPKFVASILVTLTVALSVVHVCLSLPGIDWSSQLVLSTIRNKNNATNYQILLTFVVFTEILSLVFFFFINYWSLCYRKHIRGFKSVEHRKELTRVASSRSLTVKFQIEETLNMTASFLPAVIVKCLLQVISVVASITSNALWPSVAIDTQIVLYELFNILHFQTLTTALLLSYGSGHFKRIICRARQSNKVAIEIKDNQDEYFNRLKQMFEK